jgi:hypothetical protein
MTSLGLELRPLGFPSRSQSLYRVRYPGDGQMRSCEEAIWPNQDARMNQRFMKDLIQYTSCPDRFEMITLAVLV